MLTLSTPYWRRFISVVLAIAVGYAVIVAMVVVLFDKGTASLVGTFLAALLTTILGRLESHPVGESERSRSVALPTAPPTSGLWYFFTLTLAIFGLQVLMATVFGGVIVWWLSWSDVQIAVGEIPLRLVDTISSPFFLFGVVAANCLAYFFGGYLCGKTASNVRYGHAAFSSLAVVAINSSPSIALVLTFGGAMVGEYALSLFAPFGLFSLLSVAMALMGTWVGSRQSMSRILPTRVRNTTGKAL